MKRGATHGQGDRRGSEDRATDAVPRLTGRAPMAFDAFSKGNAGVWKPAAAASVGNASQRRSSA
jgi:hypothetical protein